MNLDQPRQPNLLSAERFIGSIYRRSGLFALILLAPLILATIGCGEPAMDPSTGDLDPPIVEEGDLEMTSGGAPVPVSSSGSGSK